MTKLHFAQMNSTQNFFFFFFKSWEHIYRVQSRTQQDLRFPSTKLAVHQPLRPRATWRMLINRGESHVLVLGAPALGSLIPRLGGLSRGSPHLYQTLPSFSPTSPPPSSSPTPIWFPIPSRLALERPIRRRSRQGGRDKGRSWGAESEVANFSRGAGDARVEVPCSVLQRQT